MPARLDLFGAGVPTRTDCLCGVGTAMTGWVEALILGVVQGLTEFLPVSSSGHLVLMQAWLSDGLKLQNHAVAFDLVLHLGTLVPVFIYYRGPNNGWYRQQE